MKMCVVAVNFQLLGTILDWKFSGGGMVKSGVQPENLEKRMVHRRTYRIDPPIFNPQRACAIGL